MHCKNCNKDIDPIHNICPFCHGWLGDRDPSPGSNELKFTPAPAKKAPLTLGTGNLRLEPPAKKAQPSEHVPSALRGLHDPVKPAPGPSSGGLPGGAPPPRLGPGGPDAWLESMGLNTRPEAPRSSAVELPTWDPSTESFVAATQETATSTVDPVAVTWEAPSTRTFKLAIGGVLCAVALLGFFLMRAPTTSSKEDSQTAAAGVEAWRFGTDLYHSARQSGHRHQWGKAAKDAATAYEFLAKFDNFPTQWLKEIRSFRRASQEQFFDQEVDRARKAFLARSYNQAVDLSNTALQSMSSAWPGVDVAKRRAGASEIAARACLENHDLALAQIYLEKAIKAEPLALYKEELHSVNRRLKAGQNPGRVPPSAIESAGNRPSAPESEEQPGIGDEPSVPQGPRSGGARHAVAAPEQAQATNTPAPRPRPVNTYVPKPKQEEGLHLYQDATTRR